MRLVARLVFVGAAVVVCAAPQAFGANSVVVESRSFGPSQPLCSVGVLLTNDVPLTGIVLPLELRTVSGNAYFALPIGSNFFRRQPGSRLDLSPLGSADPGGRWPAASTSIGRFATPGPQSCSGPVSQTWPSPGTIVAVSPDAVVYSSVSTGNPEFGDSIALPPGTDPSRTDSASWLFVFPVNANLGSFEIDTCCVFHADHVSGVDILTNLVRFAFTKGTINIDDSCHCFCHGNPAVCSGGTVDILDVSYVIDVAFRGQAPIVDPCPTCPRTDTDLDCDGTTGVMDVVRIINVAFRGAYAGSTFCSPCGLGQIVASRDTMWFYCYPFFATDTFTLVNVGQTAAAFSLSTAASWLTFDIAAGTLPPLGVQSVVATVQCVPPFNNQTVILVKSHGAVSDSIMVFKTELP